MLQELALLRHRPSAPQPRRARFPGRRERLALAASYVLYERGVKRLGSDEPRIVNWDQVKVVQRASRTVTIGREGSKERGGRQWRIWKLISEDGNSFTICDQPRLASMIVGMLLVHH